MVNEKCMKKRTLFHHTAKNEKPKEPSVTRISFGLHFYEYTSKSAFQLLSLIYD